jgi:hypothetical protein
MIVNFRTHEISQGTQKLAQTSILIKKIYISNTTMMEKNNEAKLFLTFTHTKNK